MGYFALKNPPNEQFSMFLVKIALWDFQNIQILEKQCFLI